MPFTRRFLLNQFAAGATTLPDIFSAPDARRLLAQYSGPPVGDVRHLNFVMPQMFGAKGDGVDDDSPAFRAAVGFLTERGGGTLLVPYTSAGYRIGTGTSSSQGQHDTGLELGSHITIVGQGKVRLIHGARTRHGNFLFSIQDASNINIANFEITGQATAQTDQPRVAIALSGAVTEVVLQDLHLYDHSNFVIQYADKRKAAEEAHVKRLWIDRVRISGVTGKTGAGSGIDLFPRSERAGRPASSDIWVTNAAFDVSNSNDDASKHGPQGLKINNVDRLFIDNVCCVGGDVAACVVTNGCRNVQIGSLSVGGSDVGLLVDTVLSGGVGGDTANVSIANLNYERGGITAASTSAIWLKGAVANFQIERIVADGGDVRISERDANDALRNCRMGDVAISGGNFVVADARAPTGDISGLQVRSLILDSGGVRGKGRALLSPMNRRLADCRFGAITAYRTTNDTLSLGGLRNQVGSVTCHDGNLSKAKSAAVVVDSGTHNSYGTIAARGADNRMAFWVRKTEGVGLAIDSISGEVDDPAGMHFSGMDGGAAPTGAIRVVSPPLGLAGSSEPYDLFVADGADYYVLSLALVAPRGAPGAVEIGVTGGAQGRAAADDRPSRQRLRPTANTVVDSTSAEAKVTRRLKPYDRLTVRATGGAAGTVVVANLVRIT